MQASELIKRLQRHIDTFGDYECVVRVADDDSEIDITCVYADEEAERIVVTDDFDPFDE